MCARTSRPRSAAIRELENDLRDAFERIRALEGQTPQARQLQLEADQAAADLAESGYDREDDPGPEVDNAPALYWEHVCGAHRDQRGLPVEPQPRDCPDCRFRDLPGGV